MNWTRDDFKLTAGIVAAVVVGLATLGDTITDYGIPAAALPYLRLVALIVGIVSGKLATSPLPGEHDPMLKSSTLRSWLLPFLLITGLSMGCASLPLKQRAVRSLQASELALEAAHDLERRYCFVEPLVETGAHCTNPLAAQMGLTDQVHLHAARLFSDAFALQIRGATVLRAWHAGDPPPADVVGYHQTLTEILALARSLVRPQAQAFIDHAQEAVDAAAAIAATIGARR